MIVSFDRLQKVFFLLSFYILLSLRVFLAAASITMWKKLLLMFGNILSGVIFISMEAKKLLAQNWQFDGFRTRHLEYI